MRLVRKVVKNLQAGKIFSKKTTFIVNFAEMRDFPMAKICEIFIGRKIIFKKKLLPSQNLRDLGFPSRKIVKDLSAENIWKKHLLPS